MRRLQHLWFQANLKPLTRNTLKVNQSPLVLADTIDPLLNHL
jgi:hypothetical protein